jgi:hypothetical protein
MSIRELSKLFIESTVIPLNLISASRGSREKRGKRGTKRFSFFDYALFCQNSSFINRLDLAIHSDSARIKN